MKLVSSAFAHEQPIPARYGCEGDDISPPLAWSALPGNTRSLVLLCSDPDAPAGTWWHWAVYNISPDTAGLPEHYPTDSTVGVSRQAVNDFGRYGYGGPCPPPGHGVHHYHFRLVALEIERLDLPQDADCRTVDEVARNHALSEAVLTGTYSR
jgi:Raf kinase inhibitor-like YbhB/YbcL family protein